MVWWLFLKQGFILIKEDKVGRYRKGMEKHLCFTDRKWEWRRLPLMLFLQVAGGPGSSHAWNPYSFLTCLSQVELGLYFLQPCSPTNMSTKILGGSHWLKDFQFCLQLDYKFPKGRDQAQVLWSTGLCRLVIEKNVECNEAGTKVLGFREGQECTRRQGGLMASIPIYSGQSALHRTLHQLNVQASWMIYLHRVQSRVGRAGIRCHYLNKALQTWACLHVCIYSSRFIMVPLRVFNIIVVHDCTHTTILFQSVQDSINYLRFPNTLL
jgi:hypothetical protein